MNFAKNLAIKGNSIILLTLGENDALAAFREADKEISGIDVEGYRIPPSLMVDTIRCGDAFSAEFVRQYLNGQNMMACLSRANDIGAAVAMTLGGMSPLGNSHIEKLKSIPRITSRDFEVPISP